MSVIALVVPPGLPGTTPNREGASGLGAVTPEPRGFYYPPHTVATVAAVLRGAGYEVAACDAVALDYDVARCVREVLAAQPALVGVLVSWATREAESLFLSALRRDLTPAVPVICLGIAVPFILEDLAAADYLLQGEPELAFPALADQLLRQRRQLPRRVSPASLGVGGYDERGLLTDLDALPHPAWDLWPVTKYPLLSVLSSRGCQGQCAWCPYVAVQGRRFRACSPARVLAELRELTQRYRPRRIVFRDPAFAHDRERVVRICRGILADPALRPGRTLKWECESRPEHFDRELLRLMSLAGCISVKVGLETTDAAVLTRQGRVAGSDQAASYLARVSELVRACARWGIACRLFALAGLPGQTLAAAQETARFAHALRPTSFTVSALRHYPGLQFTDAACPSAEETCAQWEVLFRAQQSLERAGVQQGPRWEGAVRRFVARLANLRRRAG